LLQQDSPEADDRNDTAATVVSDRSGSRTRTRLGLVLIALSGVFWFSLFAIPFTPLTVGQKALLGGAVFLSVQILWWSGAALAGPQTVQAITAWFRKSRQQRADR